MSAGPGVRPIEQPLLRRVWARCTLSTQHGRKHLSMPHALITVCVCSKLWDDRGVPASLQPLPEGVVLHCAVPKGTVWIQYWHPYHMAV